MSRALLLPLPAAAAREHSLENHLSLAALRAGYTSVDVMARLFNAVGTARCLHEAAYGRQSDAQPDFDRAWEVLLQCSGNGCDASPLLTEDDFRILAKLVSLHDEQVQITPVHRLLAARKEFNDSLAAFVRPTPGADGLVAAGNSSGTVNSAGDALALDRTPRY